MHRSTPRLVTVGDSRIHPERVVRATHPADAPSGGVVPEDAEHGRVHVHVQMTVHVIEQKPRSLEFLELRLEFLSQLVA